MSDIKLRKFGLVFILILLVSASAFSQRYGKNEELGNFDYDIAVFPNLTDDMMKTDIYVWLSNAQLQFTMEDSTYKGHYQLNLTIYREDESVAILTKDTTLTTYVDSYGGTIDPEIEHVHHFQYLVSPDKYRFEIRFYDFNSTRSVIREVKRDIKPVESDEFYLSDIVLLNSKNLDTVTSKNVLSPRRIPIQDKIYLYLELVKPEGVDSYNIEALLQRREGNKRFAFRQDFSSKLRSSIVLLELLKENMSSGSNSLVVNANSGQYEAEAKKNVVFIQTSLSGDIKSTGSIEEKVEQLQYVARGDEWRELRNAEGEELERLFKKFWDLRDPTPGTPANELYDEYYKRIQISNTQFRSSRRDGWRSDRGRIFVIYGPPDSIEKTDPFRTNFSGYEVWYYEELKRRFIFYDEYGFGDYRLISDNY